jgi:hypothetical protein
LECELYRYTVSAKRSFTAEISVKDGAEFVRYLWLGLITVSNHLIMTPKLP